MSKKNDCEDLIHRDAPFFPSVVMFLGYFYTKKITHKKFITLFRSYLVLFSLKKSAHDSEINPLLFKQSPIDLSQVLPGN